jgi:ankyrin repeat protein
MTAESASYRKGKNLVIPSNLDDVGMKNLINEMVEHSDKEAILELIHLLRDKNHFPNINNKHFWEYDISKALIQKRDLNLIREIFPRFVEVTLSFSNWYYEPIEKGDLELVKALHDGGMLLSREYNQKKPRIYPIGDHLLCAIALGKKEIVNYFVEELGYDLNKSYPFETKNAFQMLANKNNFINWQLGSDCITPAYLAVVLNDPNLLKELIARGANCSLSNERPGKATKYRMSETDIDTPLLYTIKNGYEECFNILLEAKVDINCRGNNGRTALMTAVSVRKLTMANTLIEKGADINLTDNWEHNVLMEAVLVGDIPLIKELLNRGADPRCKDDLKRSLWEFAVKGDNSAEVLALLEEIIPDTID